MPYTPPTEKELKEETIIPIKKLKIMSHDQRYNKKKYYDKKKRVETEVKKYVISTGLNIFHQQPLKLQVKQQTQLAVLESKFVK